MAMPAYVPAPFPCPLEGCDVFPFETSPELATHMATHFADSKGTPATVITSRPGPAPVITSRPAQVVGSGRFVQVDNGFGGTTTRTRVANPPTTRATSYLRKLLDERRGIAAAEELRRQLNDARQAGALTASLVSGAITQAQRIRKR